MGYPKPIAAWKGITGCPYPVYAHPSLAIHKLVGFNTQKKDLNITTYDKSFEQGLGTFWDHFKRVFWTGLWAHPDHLMSVGPFDQNGGEMVFEPGESFLGVGAGARVSIGARIGLMNRWKVLIHPSCDSYGWSYRA